MKTPDITRKTLPLDILEENIGQLDGLPENPRYITEDKLTKLKDNITKYPEMLELRSLLVYPMPEGKYIVIGGNQRLRALRELGHTEAPCIIINEGTPVESLKSYTVLDNASFGKFDMDALANMWDDAHLDSLGVDIPTFAPVPLDSLFEEKASGGSSASSEPTAETITITLPEEHSDKKDDIAELLTSFLDEHYSGCVISFNN